MPNTQLNPIGDWINAGWQILGGVAALWQALSSISDSIYVRAPGSKSIAAVTFPYDTTSVPEGAVITSVTIMLRAATGTGVAPAGTTPSVTLQVAAQDNPARFTSKTIAVTSTPTDYEVGTYTRDAIGKAWDVYRLNFLFCRILCVLGVFDLVRVHRLWCKVNYRVRPVVTVNGPSGTVYTPSPTISWTYTQADGDAQSKTEYKIFTADQVSKISFRPETATPVFEGVALGDVPSVKLPTSINPNSYYVYVRSFSSFGAVSTWVGRQFSVQGPNPGAPGVSDPNLPGVAAVSVVPDPSYGSASLALRDTSNMLSVQAADAESAIDGAELTTVNCSYTRDSSQGFGDSTTSWRVVASSAGDVQLIGDWVEVAPGLNITGRAQTLAASTTRSTRVRVSYFDDQFAQISSGTGSSVVNSAGTWVETVYTAAVVPDGAVYARMSVEILGCANGEVHSVDRMGLMYGTSTPWSDGGHMSRNLLSAWYSSAEGSPQAGEAWVPGPGSQISSLALPYGTGSSGSMANTMGYVGFSPSIGFRAAGTTFTSPTSGSDFTLNRPAGVLAGDLMLAFVTASEYTTITPPVGWDLAATARVDDASTDTALFVLKRTADGADPSTWTDGVLAGAAGRRTAYVVAYSGAAPASEQFIGQTQVATSNDTPLYLSTPALANTDPNAWRVSAFAVSDNATGGTLTANKNVPNSVAPITYVGSANRKNNTSTGAYTIIRPANVAIGDLMIAQISIVTTSAGVFTAPTGWTIASQINTGGSYPTASAVMYRYAASGDPGSWTNGGHTGVGSYRAYTADSVAYRNVHPTVPFIDVKSGTAQPGSSINTTSVTNNNSLAWRVSMFSTTGDANGMTFSASSEAVKRVEESQTYGATSGNQSIYDSNGPLPTGASVRTAYTTRAFYTAASFALLINPKGTATVAVPDETGRQAASVGSANPWLTTRSFDSNAVVPTGSQAITGIWSPSSGTDKNSMVGWMGLIKPAVAVVAGYARAAMARPVDISGIDLSNIIESDRVTLTASFIANTTGTPFLTANFYRANVLLAAATEVGTPYNASVWSKSSATYAVPEGTTRIGMEVSSSDREIGDVVAFDRLSIAFGSDTAYRPGTSSAIHPIYSRPQIQYADDSGSGYSDWQDLPGTRTNPPFYRSITGLAQYTDHTPIPLTARRYRARTTTFGLNGDLFVSDWSSASSQISYSAENWWLKDVDDPSRNIQMLVKWGDVKVTATNTATVFQPLGREYPVVLTEGYKGQTFTLTLTPVKQEGWNSLRRMLESNKTLFLQSDIDMALWVRPIGDLSSVILATGQRKTNPLRSVDIQFIEVEAPE